MTWDDIACPVRLPAENGQYSKRCHFHTGANGMCPRHGSVGAFLSVTRKLEVLIDESEVQVSRKVEEPSLLTRIKRFVHQITKE